MKISEETRKHLEEECICPICLITYPEGFHALSRRDNKTHICSQCGTNEGIEAYKKSLIK
jgi:hypothetical protein